MAENNELQTNIIINTAIDNSGLATDVASANTQINKIGSGGGLSAGTKAVTSFKAQLKFAKEEALRLAQAGEQGTAAYREQLKAIASLTDQMQTLGRETQAFDPGNKFQALAKVSSLAVNSLSALQGTFTLLGVNAETANESIAKLQSLQAIVGLLDNFGDSMDVLNPFLDNLLASNVALTEQTVVVEANTVAQGQNLAVTESQIVATEAQAVATTEVAVATEGATIVTKLFNLAMQNIPFIAIATALIAVVTGFIKFKKQIFEAIPFLKDIVEVTGAIIEKFTDFAGITSEASRASEAFSISMKKMNGELEFQNKLLAAKGGNERQQYLNSRKILDNQLADLALKKKADELSAQEYKEGADKLIQDKIVLDAVEQKRLDTITQKRADEHKKKVDEANKQAKALRDEAKKNVDEALKVIEKGYITERSKEELAITENYKSKIATTKKAYGANSAQVKTLLDAQATELGEVKLKYDDILDKAFEEQNDKALSSYDLRIKALQSKANELRKNNPERADEINNNVTIETTKIRREETLNNNIINDTTDVNNAIDPAQKRANEIQLLKDQYQLELETKVMSDAEKLTAESDFQAKIRAIQLEGYEADKELKASQKQNEQDLQDAKYNIANQGLDTLGTLFGKNKALADMLFAVEKGLAIGQIITSTARSIAIAQANLAAIPKLIPAAAFIGVPIPNPAYAIASAATALTIGKAKLNAGAGIASIVAASVGKFMNGGGASISGGSPDSGASGGSGINYNQAPVINPNGGRSSDIQKVEITNISPLKAYVTQKDIKNSRDAEAFDDAISDA